MRSIIFYDKINTAYGNRKNELSNDIFRRNFLKAPFTLYRITSERSDFHTGFGCCLHYTTPIRCAPRSENHSALEVIQKVIRYVPEQFKQ